MSAYAYLVGCWLPIQQAPMGTCPHLNSPFAVARAGGVGTITALGVPFRGAGAPPKQLARPDRNVTNWSLPFAGSPGACYAEMAIPSVSAPSVFGAPFS